jgi:hypothetical protein
MASKEVHAMAGAVTQEYRMFYRHRRSRGSPDYVTPAQLIEWYERKRL